MEACSETTLAGAFLTHTLVALAAESNILKEPLIGTTRFGYLACEKLEDLRTIQDNLTTGDFLAADRLIARLEQSKACVRLEDGMPAAIVFHNGGEPPFHYAITLVEVPGGEVIPVYTKFDAVEVK